MPRTHGRYRAGDRGNGWRRRCPWPLEFLLATQRQSLPQVLFWGPKHAEAARPHLMRSLRGFDMRPVWDNLGAEPFPAASA